MEDSTNTQPAFHGNGRNKRRSQSKIAANFAPVCGVIDDISTFSEKLSGQHIKGYEVEEQQKVEVVESVSDEQNSNSAEVSQSVSETPEREGPEFEEADSQNRTLEVGLKKMPAKHENIAKGAVSYASASAALDKEAQKQHKGLFVRIKRILSNIFGKKKQKTFKNDRYNKKNFHRNGDKKFHRDGNYKGNYRKNGKNFNNRRRNDFKRRAPQQQQAPKAEQ